MKEVKQFSKSYIFISALYVVLGVALLAWPMMSVKMICYGLAVAMIVIGISYGVMYFTKDNLQGFLQMDLVIGKGQKSAVLTMIERKTNMFLQTKLTSKKPAVVAMAAWRLLLPYKANVLTITTDNGSEFMNHKWLARRIGATVYFADPFCSGQKGAVENANKILRQYFPKGTDFREVEQAELDRIQAKINRRPREKLGFSSQRNVFFKLLS